MALSAIQTSKKLFVGHPAQVPHRLCDRFCPTREQGLILVTVQLRALVALFIEMTHERVGVSAIPREGDCDRALELTPGDRLGDFLRRQQGSATEQGQTNDFRNGS